MYCPYCGKEIIRTEAKFCPWCGKPTIRPKQSQPVPSSPIEPIGESPAPKAYSPIRPEDTGNFKQKNKNPWPWIIIFCVAVLALGIGIFIGYSKMNKDRAPLAINVEPTTASDDNNDGDFSSGTSYYGEGAAAYLNEISDIEAYYRENGEIVSITEAQSSRMTETETQVVSNLTGRGFVDYPVTYEYSLNGDFGEPVEASTSSTEKHPVYETYYMTESKNLWTLMEVNGQIMANPVSYNMESDKTAQTIISESSSIMSYDSSTNRFYETIPSSSSLIVKIVERIDAATLEKLTNEEIDRL